MKPAAILPRALVARKPLHGKPCNGCGVCCMVTVCELGQHVFGIGVPGPCPGLAWRDGSAVCSVADEPLRHVGRKNGERDEIAALRLYALHLIGAGDGCDCRINGEQPDAEFNRRLARLDIERARLNFTARKAWGLPRKTKRRHHDAQLDHHH